MPRTLADLEARIAALEAERTGYRAVLAVITPLGQRPRRRRPLPGVLAVHIANTGLEGGSLSNPVDSAWLLGVTLA